MKKRRIAPLVLTLCMGFVATACGEQTPTVEQVSVKLTIEKTSLEVGESTTFKVEVENSSEAYKIDIADTSVVKVEGDKLVALKAGSTDVSAVVGETKSNVIKVTVKEKAEPAKISVSINTPAKTALNVGETLTLTAKVENNADNLPVKWASSNAEVLSVSDAGVLTALKVGTAEVTAKVGDVTSAAISFTVTAPVLPVTVEITQPAKTALEVGETLKLTASVANNVDNLPVVWKSSDISVLTVDETGLVTAVKSGSAKITATVGEVVSEPITLVVNEPDLPITVTIEAPAKTSLEVGETLKLTAIVVNNTDNLPVVWASSDATVLSVNAEGVVSAIKEGSATVTAKVGDVTSLGVTFEVKEPVLPISVTIDAPAKTNLMVTETLQLTAKVENNVDNLPLVWKSSDSEVLSVDDKGLVTALKAGTAEVTATVGDAVSEKVSFVVTAPAAEEIVFEIRKTTIGVGEKVEFKTSVLPAGSDQTVIISSSDEMKVRVDGNTIEGISETEPDSPIQLSVETPSGLKKTVDITVTDMATSALDEIKAVLTKSSEIEKEKVNGGTFSIVTEENGEVDSYNKGSYSIYSDNKVKVNSEELDSRSGITKTNRSIGISEDQKTYYDIYQEIDEEGISEISYSTDIFEIVDEEETVYGEITLEEALNNVTLPTILDETGLSNDIYENYINHYSYYSSVDAKDAMTFEFSENAYKLTTSFENYNGLNKIETVISLDSEGLVSNFTSKTELYESDYDGAISETISSSTVVEFTLSKGERTPSSDDMLKVEDLYATDYECHLSDSYGGGSVETFNLGSTVRLIIDSVSPDTYYDDADPIYIESVSDETAVESMYDSSFKVIKPIEDLKVVVSSRSGIKKEFVIDVVQPAVETISFPSERTTFPTHDLVNATREITVSSSPSGSVADIDVKVIPGTGNAEVTMIDNDTFSITGTKAGTVTVEAYDKNVGKSSKITREITYFDDTDAGITDYLTSTAVYVDDSSYEIVLTKDTETTGTLKVLYDEYGYLYEMTAKFTATNGEVVFSDFVGVTESDYIISDVRTYSLTSSSRFSRWNIDVELSWDSDTISFYLY